MPYLLYHSRPAARALIATGVASLLVLASACSSSKSASGSGGSGTSSTGAGVAAMQADVAKFAGEVTSYPSIASIAGVSGLKDKTVWYIPIGSAVPILNAFGVGVQEALAKVGIKYQTCDGKFLPTTIAACLNQAATQGASGVITGYIDYKLVPAAFDNLVAHKIPVLVAGAANDSGASDSPAQSFYDTTPLIEQLQKLMNEAVVADSNGKAKVLFLGVTDSPQTLAGAKYSKQYFKDNCPGCSFTEIDYNTASLSKVPSQVSAALISNPDTTYVLSELDASAAGALSGIQTAGYTKKVKLAGTNGALDSLQRIAAGGVQFLDVGFSPNYLGWQFADSIVRMLLGSPAAQPAGIYRVFTKDNVGSLTLTPDVYATNAWYGNDDFQKNFLTAWGLS